MLGFMRLHCGRGGYTSGPISIISSEREFRLGMGPSLRPAAVSLKADEIARKFQREFDLA
jgi:hypothetical protein